MRPDLYNALEEATRNEFDIMDPVAGGERWGVFLGRPVNAPARLALLMLQPAEDDDGELELEIAETLDAGLAIGRTTCLTCGGVEQGWPRFCSACGTDLTGVAAEAGASAGELLDEVRLALDDTFDVLGYMPHTEGGGPLFFVREAETRRLAGLRLHAGADGELELSPSWTPDEAARDDDGATTAAVHAAPSPWDGDRDPVIPPPSFYDPPEPRPSPPGRTAGFHRTALIGGSVLVAAAIVLAIVGWNRARASAVQAAQTPAAGIQNMAPRNTPALDTATTANRIAAAEYTDPEPASPAGRRSEEEPAPRTPDAGPARVPDPVPTPAPAPPPAPTPGGITDAIGRYAAAVQSRQVDRISQAYPGITAAELQRWERFFRPLPADAGLRSRYDVLQGPSVNGARGEVLFTLTLSYQDASGNPAELPLPLRGLLTWTGGGWSLDEVRSYP